MRDVRWIRTDGERCGRDGTLQEGLAEERASRDDAPLRGDQRPFLLFFGALARMVDTEQNKMRNPFQSYVLHNELYIHAPEERTVATRHTNTTAHPGLATTRGPYNLSCLHAHLSPRCKKLENPSATRDGPGVLGLTLSRLPFLHLSHLHGIRTQTALQSNYRTRCGALVRSHLSHDLRLHLLDLLH